MTHRQFSYLDDLAVRSLLASESIAPPESVTQVSETTQEGGAGAGVSAGFDIPLVGSAEGGVDLSGSKTGRDLLETKKRINDQYLFNRLYEEVEEEIEDLTSTDTVSLSEGDLVQVDGVLQTDAIYRLLTLIHTYSEILDLDEREKIDEAYDLLYSDAIGLSLDHESQFEFGMRISPNNLWVDQQQAFLGSKSHVVFGRISDTFGGQDTWDYIHASEMIESVLVDETMDWLRTLATDFINALGSAEEDVEVPEIAETNVEAFSDLESLGETTQRAPIQLDIQDKEIALDGPGFVIYPIAIYW